MVNVKIQIELNLNMYFNPNSNSHLKRIKYLKSELVHGRYEMLQENVNAFRREIEALREKNQKMTATHQSHEQIIHTMTQDLREANEKLTMAEVRRKYNKLNGLSANFSFTDIVFPTLC